MPSPEGRNTLSNRAVGELRDIRRRVLAKQPLQGQYGGETHQANGVWYYAKTASAVTAGSFSVPTSFTWTIWLPDPSSGASPPPLIISSDSNDLGVSGANYWNFACAIGTQFRMIYSYGYWIPSWADC